MRKIVKTNLGCLVAIVGLFSCGTPSSEEVSSTTKSTSEIEEVEDAVNFYVLGDFGINGKGHQQEVADAMNEAAYTVEPEFIVTVGDNFYQNGVASIHDPQWQKSFTDVYDGENMVVEWYPVLGNHDYRGNVEAQIEYSEIDRKWNLPDRYYFKDVIEDGDTLMRLVFIDTCPFEDKYYEEKKYENVWAQDSTRQKNWMDSVLQTSPAKWNIVVGHHPFYTSGKRAFDDASVRRHLENVLEEHNVDVYFAGHEHDLQHQSPEDKFTEHFISGSGAKVRAIKKKHSFTKYAEAHPGFMIASATLDSMVVQVVGKEGDLRYHYTIKK